MDYLSLITEAELETLEPFFPTPRRPRNDVRRTVSGVIFVIKFGVPWRAAPPEYGPHKTLYSCFRRWSRKGIFHRILSVVADRMADTRLLMMDSTFCKASRHACSMGLNPVEPEPGSNRTKGGLHVPTPAPEKPLERRRIGRTKGGMNSKVHCLADAEGRLMQIHLTAGQKSDCEGAKVLLEALPPTKEVVADRAYDTDEIRNRLKRRKIKRCIPPRRNRKTKFRYDRDTYKERNKIERAFSRLKDWNRVAYRRDRCPELFLSACCLAAICIFRL